MTREERLDSLRAYVNSFDNLPEHVLNQGISMYEFKITLELILEILEDQK